MYLFLKHFIVEKNKTLTSEVRNINVITEYEPPIIFNSYRSLNNVNLHTSSDGFRGGGVLES